LDWAHDPLSSMQIRSPQLRKCWMEIRC
jgi:hypothetical protein